MRHWIKQNLIGIDQLANTLFGGWADETISSRCYRLHRDAHPCGVFMYLVNALFFWEEGHCYQAYKSEQERLQSPPEQRIKSNEKIN